MRWVFGWVGTLYALAGGCGGEAASDAGSAGSGAAPRSTGGGAAGGTLAGGTFDGGSNVGGAFPSGAPAGGNLAGGAYTGGVSTGGALAGGADAGGTSTGGSHTGGSDTGGMSAGGGDTGGMHAGGSDTGGTVAGGGDAGGAGSCIDVCGLYGAPCCIGSGACIEPGGSCVLELLAASLLSPPYEYETLEQQFAGLPQDVLVSIADTDIAWAAADSAPAGRIELQLTPEASALHGDALMSTGDHPFRFSCNGQRLFVGVTYFSCGAAAILTPVLHVGRNEEDTVVLALGAQQGVWCGLDWGDPELARRIDRPELREVFCQRGALGELDPAAPPPDR